MRNFSTPAALKDPFEANVIKLFDAMQIDIGGLALPKKLVLASLALDPSCKRGALGVMTGYIAMTNLFAEGPKLIETFYPGGAMGVPDKTNRFELFNAFVGHCRYIAVFF